MQAFGSARATLSSSTGQTFGGPAEDIRIEFRDPAAYGLTPELLAAARPRVVAFTARVCAREPGLGDVAAGHFIHVAASVRRRCIELRSRFWLGCARGSARASARSRMALTSLSQLSLSLSLSRSLSLSLSLSRAHRSLRRDVRASKVCRDGDAILPPAFLVRFVGQLKVVALLKIPRSRAMGVMRHAFEEFATRGGAILPQVFEQEASAEWKAKFGGTAAPRGRG